MNIPDVPVATNAEGLSHVSVQPAIQEEEKGNTLPAVRILFFFQHCTQHCHLLCALGTISQKLLIIMAFFTFSARTSS